MTYPTAATTGVTPGWTLRPWTGELRSGVAKQLEVHNGQTFKVVEGYDFGIMTQPFQCDDDEHVIVRNCNGMSDRYRDIRLIQKGSSGSLIVAATSLNCAGNRGVQADAAELLVWNSKILGSGESAVEKNDPKSRSNLWVQSCYIRTLTWPQGSHTDGIQIGDCGMFAVVGNTIDIPWYSTDGYISNSNLGLWAEGGDVSGVGNVWDNLLNGGGVTVYLEEKSGYKFRGLVSVKRNQFGIVYGPKCGKWGPLANLDLPDQMLWPSTGADVNHLGSQVLTLPQALALNG